MAAASRLHLRVCHGRSEATVIAASGEIDLVSSARLRAELLAAVESGTAVLDTADVCSCDASGVRAHRGRALRPWSRRRVPPGRGHRTR